VSDHSTSGMGALSSRERAKLTAILSRLSSSFEGERAAAGLLATTFVSKHNLMWSDLAEILRPVPSSPTASVDPPPRCDRRRSGRQWRGYCRRRSVGLGAALDMST
jgi:hypothetical protein